MKKYLILILVILTTNLNGQNNTRSPKKAINYTSTNKVPKYNLYSLKDTINYKNFEVIYNYNAGDEKYSSLDSTFCRSYSDRERNVKFGLTKEEKALIYRIVKETDFFSLPEELKMNTNISISPFFSTEITIRIGKYTHRVLDKSNTVLDKTIEKRFREVESVISSIIFDKIEVKKLPKSDRVYL